MTHIHILHMLGMSGAVYPLRICYHGILVVVEDRVESCFVFYAHTHTHTHTHTHRTISSIVYSYSNFKSGSLM
jgi:hypothetical protein